MEQWPCLLNTFSSITLAVTQKGVGTWVQLLLHFVDHKLKLIALPNHSAV